MKAVLQYIILVGIPVATVLILVHLGEMTMKAPAFIGGNWALETIAATEGEGSACPGFGFDSEPVLSISQSGLYLEIAFNDRDHTTLSGVLTDLTLNAQKSTDSATFVFDAVIDRQPEPDRLEGTLVISSCDESLSLIGNRRPDIDQTSAEH